MQKELNKIAKDTNIFLKRFIKKQKKSELMTPMQYGLFSGGKKIRSKLSRKIWCATYQKYVGNCR